MATGPIAQASLAIAMIGVGVLAWGGVRLLRRREPERMRGGLMLGVAIVILANVLIWTWP